MEKRMNELERRQDTLEEVLKLYINENRATVARHDAELREIRERRETDRIEMEAKRAEMEAKREADRKEFDAKIDKLDGKIDTIGKHVQSMTTATIIGVGAIVVAVIMGLIK